jgi:multidrug resistance efflux pump
MSDNTHFPLFQKAVGRHLTGIRGLSGVQAFLRDSALEGAWIEAARLGKVQPDRVEAVLAAYDPRGGGAVEAIAGADGAWSARYMLGGPGLDLVLLMRLEGLPPADLQAQLQTIEAKTGWLMLAALSDRSDEIGGMALGTEVGAQILLDAARARSRRILADQWIARLERVLSPDLIAVSWMRGGHARLVALSGGGTVERNSEARSQIEALADHAVRARGPQLIRSSAADATSGGTAPPAPEDADLPDPLSQAAQEDAWARVELLGGDRGLTLPVYDGDEPAAAVVVIWSSSNAAGPVPVEAADLVAQVLGDSLAIQARAYPSIWRRLGNWAWGSIRAVFGATAWKLKLALVLLALATAILAVWPTRYEPSFTARIEAQDRRVISAPFDGFLAEAPYQLGDLIPAGSMVLAMEDSDLVLQQAQAGSELAEIEAEIQTARAQRDTSAVQSLEAQRRQVELDLDLLARQLRLARFTAEGPAAVVGGDAWRRVGGRVRLGEPLLELAAPDGFRVLAFIDEDWVADLAPGRPGTLLLTAYPDTPLPVSLDAVTADPQMRDGVNTFSAWLSFDAGAPDIELLDGMRGIVRVDGGETTMLAAYTRGAMRWLRRTWWRWS